MKKVLSFFFASIITCAVAQAQAPVTIGLRLAPGLSFNRVEDASDANRNISSDGTALRFTAGPVFDFFLTNQYAFSTGLWYTTRRVGLSGVRDPNNITNVSNGVYNLQYLQIPISLKLFTNDIATDTRLYFQVGGTADIKIREKRGRSGDFAFVQERVFRGYDVGLLLGAGTEILMSQSTILFGGISYNRGLIDVFRNKQAAFDNSRLNNDFIALEVGIKF